MYKHRTVRERLKAFKAARHLKRKQLAIRMSANTAVAGVLAFAFAAFSLAVWLQPAAAAPPPLVLGELPYQKLLTKPLTDKATVLVNAANGNVVLKTQDLRIGGAGPALNITRYYNSMASGSGQAGHLTTLSVGADVSVTANAGGSATYQGPSGYKVTFPSNGSGGYTASADFPDGVLTPVSGGGWTLKFNKSGEVFTFNAAGKQTKHADASGLAITYAYNTNGTLASATDAQGKVTAFSNYSGGKVGTITDPAGRTVQYTYDSSGKLTDVTDTNGKTWHYEYWDGTHITWLTDPRNISTTFGYDGSGRVATVNYNEYQSTKATWTYAYNTTTNKVTVTDPLSHDTVYTYDTSGRVTNVLNAVGDNKGSTWDASHNQTASVSSANQATNYTYDTLNNLTAAQQPASGAGVTGATDSFEYANTAQPHRPSKRTDEAGNTTVYSYNVNGSVTSAASANASSTAMGTVTSKYQGDPDGGGTVACGAKTGQICSSTDARNNTTTFGYDANGNVTTVTPLGPISAKTYTYDSLARIKTYTDGNGSKVTLTYDNADRVTQKAYTVGSTSISQTYDNNGNLTQRSDAAGTTAWTYDNHNRITKIQQTGKTDLNYTYDLAGNLKTEQGPFGTVSYRYDAANQVDRVSQPNGANQDFVYADGRITTAYLPGDIVQYMTYDNAGRQTSVKATRLGTTLTHYTGTYTTTANKDMDFLQTETDNLAGTSSAYGYDGMGRLTSVTGSGTGADSYTYTYDATGNRTQHSKNGVYSAILGFNAANQLTTSGGAVAATYDSEGNQTSDSTGLYMEYNEKNQASEFTPAGGSPITAGYLDSTQSGRTGFGSTTQRNGLLGLYSDTTGSTATYYTRLPAGSNQALGQTIGSSYYYYLTDLRGSTAKMTNASGTVVNTYKYDPYGTQTASTGSTANAIRYANGYYDSATNLTKFGERYYNPADARWTQLDPSGQDFGYLYAGANPVNFVDPEGLALTQPFLVEAVKDKKPAVNPGTTTPLECNLATAITGITLDGALTLGLYGATFTPPAGIAVAAGIVAANGALGIYGALGAPGAC